MTMLKAFMEEIPMVKKMIILVAGAAFVTVAHNITGAPLFSLMFCTVLIFIFAGCNLKILSTGQQYIVYLSLFLLKAAALVYQAAYKSLPMGGNDWVAFNFYATNILKHGSGIIHIFLGNHRDLFSKLVALIYTTFGRNIEQVYFYVFVSSLITFTYIFLTAYEITGDKTKSQWTAILFMVWPIEFILSITCLRDMPIQCLTIMSFYYFVKFIKYRRLADISLAVVLAALTSMMHSGMIGLLLVYLLVAVIYDRQRIMSWLNPMKALLCMIILILIITSPVATAIMGRFTKIDNMNDILVRSQRIEGNTAYIYEAPQEPVDLLLQTPYRMFMFAFAPLPWQVYDFPTAIAWLLDGLLRIFILYRILLYFIRYRPGDSSEKALKISLILILLITYFIFAWGTFSFGTAMRHRAKLFPLEIIMVYPCYEIMKAKLRELKG